jgi:hypothetical protein
VSRQSTREELTIIHRSGSLHDGELVSITRDTGRRAYPHHEDAEVPSGIAPSSLKGLPAVSFFDLHDLPSDYNTATISPRGVDLDFRLGETYEVSLVSEIILTARVVAE